MNRNDTRFTSNNNKSTFLSSYLASDDEEDNLENFGQTNDNSERLEILAPIPLNIPNTIENGHHDLSTDTSCSSSSTMNSNYNQIHQESYLNIWNDNLIESATPRRAQYRVIFEIIKARTITNNETRQKFVNYTILMKRVPGLETEPAIIERRYSEFRNFYNAIKRKYPLLLKDIIFPKKIFIGNFSAEVIAERSLAFQKFLTYCLSLPEIRSSKEFAQFLYYPELKETKNCLKSIRLEEAASILENVYYIQSKLSSHSGQPDRQLIHTLCCLIGCLNAVDNTTDAKKLARKTFEMLFENPVVLIPSHCVTNDSNAIFEVNNLYESSQLIVPLILLSLRHEWFSGQQKLALEKKLEELCRKRSLPRNIDSHPKLLEIILRKDFTPIL
ncbi:Phosphatidylinositol binding [Dermatophagoides farinae]|uniref:Phosphatidylinositol binding n=1 Tax=Dermatophagoides farinae TaxID=6954 RepID=A0A922ICQ5_DERFA|nr:sorting nexin-20-like [Dermatophagoides farinae]KAH7642391.1 sorting nexin-21 [Dermatophagoides farinae]KAH9529627.1 Phosphatidylinositol binding [Dermatophagoides farinae]